MDKEIALKIKSQLDLWRDVKKGNTESSKQHSDEIRMNLLAYIDGLCDATLAQSPRNN